MIFIIHCTMINIKLKFHYAPLLVIIKGFSNWLTYHIIDLWTMHLLISCGTKNCILQIICNVLACLFLISFGIILTHIFFMNISVWEQEGPMSWKSMLNKTRLNFCSVHWNSNDSRNRLFSVINQTSNPTLEKTFFCITKSTNISHN